MKQVLPVLPVVCLLMITSCVTANHYALNKQEMDYISKTNRHRTVSILYDNKAIRNLDSNGIYTVKINETDGAGTLCTMDTNVVKIRALEVARTVSGFMNFKEHHRYIDVEFDSILNNGKKNSLGDDISCSYTVRMPVEDVSQTRLVRVTNNYDAPTRFRQ